MLINLGNYLINMDNVASIASVDGKGTNYNIEIETNVGSIFKAVYKTSTERDNDYYLIIRKYKEKASCITLSGTASVVKPTATTGNGTTGGTFSNPNDGDSGNKTGVN